MAEMKKLAESSSYLDNMTQEELGNIAKRAAMRVANELGYSQKCKDAIKKCVLPEDVDKVMENERRNYK